MLELHSCSSKAFMKIMKTNEEEDIDVIIRRISVSHKCTNYHNNNKKCKEQKGDSVKYIMKKKVM